MLTTTGVRCAFVMGLAESWQNVVTPVYVRCLRPSPLAAIVIASPQSSVTCRGADADHISAHADTNQLVPLCR